MFRRQETFDCRGLTNVDVILCRGWEPGNQILLSTISIEEFGVDIHSLHVTLKGG